MKSEGALDKRGVFTGAYLLNPFTEQPVPLYLADYVLMGYGTGAIMAVPGQDQRDWDFATVYGLPIVRTVQPPDGLGGRGLHRRRAGHQQPVARRARQGRGHRQGHRLARGARHRRGPGQLPPARLAAVAPAVLGLPDPGRLLRRLRHPAGARRPAAGAGARRRRVPADRPVAAAAPRGVPAHDVPELRRAGPPRDRHDGHVRRLVVVLPALHRSVEQRRAVLDGGGRVVDAGRPVHRRRRARHPPPDVRPLLHQGAGRPGHRARRSCASRSRGCSPRA